MPSKLDFTEGTFFGFYDVCSQSRSLPTALETSEAAKPSTAQLSSLVQKSQPHQIIQKPDQTAPDPVTEDPVLTSAGLLICYVTLRTLPQFLVSLSHLETCGGALRDTKATAHCLRLEPVLSRLERERQGLITQSWERIHDGDFPRL